MCPRISHEISEVSLSFIPFHMAFLIATNTKRKIAANIILMVLVFTVVVKRDSRTLFGNMSNLLTVERTNNRFFVLFTVFS